MSKKKKKVENSENQKLNSVNSIINSDLNKIENATEEAIKTVDNVVFSDNLIEPDDNIKSIRELNISEDNIEQNNNDVIVEDIKNNEENNVNETTTENSDETNSDETSSNSNDSSDNKKYKKSHKKLIIILLIVLLTSLIILCFSTIFALVFRNSNKIINGIEIEKLDVSNLTEEEAINLLKQAYEKQTSKVIVLKHNDYKYELSPKQIEVSFNVQDAVNTAYSIGRSSNIFKDNFDIIISFFKHTEIEPNFSLSEEIFNSIIKEMESNYSDILIESSYYIDENDLILSKGKDGVIINKEELKNKIKDVLTNFNLESYEIDVPVINKQASALDLKKVYQEVTREPKDAYFTTEPYKIYPHVDGIDFDISLDECITNYANCTEETYTIPLKLIPPKITTNKLGIEAFPDELASYKTTFSASNVNRSTNIRLASEKINGTVVMPGEIFSYNATVGERTAAKGYKSAGVYVGGQVTTGIGGGICQVSSTLYNAVLLSNLEIVARYNHCFNTGYVPVSRDATVSWGGPDFKFKNTRNYPIKIICTGTNGTEYVQILGLKEKDECDVEIQSYVTKWISYSTITRKDSSLPKGETKVIESGSNGCKSVAYRILKKDGEVISKELLSQDVYDPHNRIIAVGTAE